MSTSSRPKTASDVWNDIHRYAKEGFASHRARRFRPHAVVRHLPAEARTRAISCGASASAAAGSSRGNCVRSPRSRQDYGRGFGDVTTRQCIQLHWMTIEHFPDAFDRIGDKAGLYTQFACGDTPRNVCSCPLAGLLKNEYVGIGDLPKRLSDMFKAAGKDLSNLPRKVQDHDQPAARCTAISRRSTTSAGSACDASRTASKNAASASWSAAGFRPRRTSGSRCGFSSPKPRWPSRSRLIWKGMCELFRDSDELRYKRIRARLKFLVADKGWEWIRDELEKRIGFRAGTR